MENEVHGNTHYNWCTQNVPQRIDKGLEELEIGGWAETI